MSHNAHFPAATGGVAGVPRKSSRHCEKEASNKEASDKEASDDKEGVGK